MEGTGCLYCSRSGRTRRRIFTWAYTRATAGNGRHWLLVLQSKWTYKEKNFYMGIHKNDKGVRWMASPNYDDMKHMVDVEGYGKIKTEHPWAQIRPKSFQKW